MRTDVHRGSVLLVMMIIAVFSLEITTLFSTDRSVVMADGVIPFSQIVLDPDGPRGEAFYGIHSKTVGDLNGDGYPDAVVAGATVGQPLIWYEMPAGTRHVVSELGGWSTDAATGDMDGDGDLDILVSNWYRTGPGLEWFENLGGGMAWARHTIGGPQAHDLELVDLDLDRDLDIVTRLQGAEGNAVEVWRQDSPFRWTRATIRNGVPAGEGLTVADIDGDGDPDVVLGAVWLSNPRDVIGGTWIAHTATTTWTEPDTIVAVGDINRDGRPDLVLTPSEEAGERYRISWFEAPPDPVATTEWTEHVIASDVEAVLHSLQLADFDKDGDLDLATATMHQGMGPHQVLIYTNVGVGGRGSRWARQAVARTATHSMRAADYDRDGDVDLFGANWSDDANVYLWRNDRNERLPLDAWVRHVIDDARPWNAVFIQPGDIDRDGRTDVITGGWWYRNPGGPGGAWTRHTIGSPLNNMAAVHDFDQDGDLDVLGTSWAGSGAGPSFVLAVNSGAGSFDLLEDLPAGEGDFLQGVAVGRFSPNGPLDIALSWHAGTGRGIQMLTSPWSRAPRPWQWQRISEFDQQEQISAGDVDGDGDLDLLLGTRWLRNDGTGFTLQMLSTAPDPPDRNRLGDIDGDGRLDAIVGFQGISVPAKLAWYSRGDDPGEPWTEHLIGMLIGPMSLDVADMDLDGDLDVIVGEHNLARPETARVVVFENADGSGTSWVAHVVHAGDEHHDGTQVVDIDADGDLDIISIGWGHARVLLYQNMAMELGVRIFGPVPPPPGSLPDDPPAEPSGPDAEPPVNGPPVDVPPRDSAPPAPDAQGDQPGGEQVAGRSPVAPGCGAGAAFSLAVAGLTLVWAADSRSRARAGQMLQPGR